MNSQEQGSCQVIISGIPPDISAAEVARFFIARFGMVHRCKLKADILDHKSQEHVLQRRGYGFIEFVSQKVAKYVHELGQENGLLLNNVKLKVWLGRPRRLVPDKLHKVLRVKSLELAFRSSSRKLCVAWQASKKLIQAEFNFQGRRLNLFIPGVQHQKCSLKNSKNGQGCSSVDVRLEFFLRNIKAVNNGDVPTEDGCLVLLLEVSTAPRIFFRTADDDVWEHSALQWWSADDADPWTRTTDFVSRGSIGLCSLYRLHVPFIRNANTLKEVVQMLKEFHWVDSWRLQDDIRLEHFVLPGGIQLRPFLTFLSFPGPATLSFHVQFLLNAVVNRWAVPVTSITSNFVRLVARTDPDAAVAALTKMVFYFRPAFDPYRRFQLELKRHMQKSVKKPKLDPVKLPENYILVRRLIITPSAAYCMPPEPELGNRVLRHHREISDRFLRVIFMDEGQQELSSAALQEQFPAAARDFARSSRRTPVYDRILKIVKKGFNLCGRRYKFLANSTNQLREKSAWFLAEDEERGLTVASLCKWMGNFTEITNVAKCAARMGLCFSSCHLSVRVPTSEVERIEDEYSESGLLMTDGIGKMTIEFAAQIARELFKHCDGPVQVPSAFQIRYAGYKGVLAAWPAPEGTTKKIFFRPSMYKFESGHTTMEILEWSRFWPCYLNRQIICLLSTLGVPDKVFISMQEKMLKRLDRVLESRVEALKFVETGCFEDLHSTLTNMLQGGLGPKTEPHLRSMLRAVRAMQLQLLLTKTHIFVPKGRWMLGTVDETGTLNYGECFLQVSGPRDDSASLNSSWGVQAQANDLRVITGPVCFGKNPCLHPGDLRFLTAVDRPELHSQKDTLVLPKRGPRSHANEASGSDMDGDVYFVHWDPSLIPPGGKSAEPMDYDVIPAKQEGAVTQEMIGEYFVNQMLNDSIGVICNAHVVHADKSPRGAFDEDCLRLAKQAAIAVDFPKTGIPGEMPRDLRPEAYPDFMEKEEGKKTYKSEKVLGILYRTVRRKVDLEEEGKRKRPEGREGLKWYPTAGEVMRAFDPQLEAAGYEEHLEEAVLLKRMYDRRLWLIMQQHGILTEGELVTAHILHLSRHMSKRQGSSRDRIKLIYVALWREFREYFLFGRAKGFKDTTPSEQVGSGRRTGSDDEQPLGVQSGGTSDKTNGALEMTLEGGNSCENEWVEKGPDKHLGGRIAKPSPEQKARAYAWYYVTYHPWYVKREKRPWEEGQEEDEDDMPGLQDGILVSFPWINADVLSCSKSSLGTKSSF